MFIRKKWKNAFWAFLSGLRDNVRTPSIARWKARGRFYVRHNWTFFAFLWLRRYKWKSVEVGVFWRRWVTLSADFRGKRESPANHCWCQSSRVTALSCGIKISTVYHIVLSRVTDRQTDGQNYDSQGRPRICSRGKNIVFNVHKLLGCIGGWLDNVKA